MSPKLATIGLLVTGKFQRKDQQHKMFTSNVRCSVFIIQGLLFPLFPLQKLKHNLIGLNMLSPYFILLLTYAKIQPSEKSYFPPLPRLQWARQRSRLLIFVLIKQFLIPLSTDQFPPYWYNVKRKFSIHRVVLGYPYRSMDELHKNVPSLTSIYVESKIHRPL